MQDNCHVDEYRKEVRAKTCKKPRWLTGCGRHGLPAMRAARSDGLNRLDGVFEASVYLENAVAEVYYDPNQVKVQDMVNAVASAGDAQKHRYRAQVIEQ